jgi:UDP-N-acetylglucosamine transferase subunit ALG13
LIYVTVGAQMPFDRLVHAVDAWAARTGRDDVFAQIGRGGEPPVHIEWTRLLDPDPWRQRVADCDFVVTHAGMGSILTALELGKPLVLMPRRAALGETRNDHQIASAQAMLEVDGIAVARDEHELPAVLDAAAALPAPTRVGSQASDRLLTAIRRFIDGEEIDAAPTVETVAEERRRAA